MFLMVIVEDIPIKEGKKILEYFKNFTTYLWKDGFYVYKDDNLNLEIKGPKIEKTNECEWFKQKMFKKYNNSCEFSEKNGYLYATPPTQEEDFCDILSHINWINPIKIKNNFCCRPVQKIYTNHQNFTYCGISSTIISEEDVKKIIKLLPSMEDKLKITKTLLSFISQEKLEELLFSINHPQIIVINYEDKYYYLPIKAVKYILQEEQKVITRIDNNKITNFYFIADNKEQLEHKNFQISINSRLEDLCMSYERDKKLVHFHHKQEILWEFSLHLFHQHLENINITFLQELINNYKSDFSTSIVEEYPNLLGVFSSHLYDENVLIKEGFLALSGEFKNIYGVFLYITIKIYFLQELSDANKLPTSTHDPFGMRGISTEIIKLIVEYQLWYLNINDEIMKFLKERFYLVMMEKYKFAAILKYESLNFTNILKILDYMNINYQKVKQIINRCKYFFKENDSSKYFIDAEDFISNIENVENLLNHQKIENNIELTNYINDFMIKINNIFYLNGL